MKRLSTLLALASFISLSAAADETNAVAPRKVGAKEAGKHFDETLTVTGKVAQVTVREKLVFVNLDEPHPNSPFTAVVFSANTNQFGDISKLKGKAVEVTGKVKNYNDSPEIVMDSTNQLKIVEAPAASDKPEKK